MAITLPLPVRVAAGLVATGIQLVRSLPEEIPAIPVALVGNAMKLSMKVQQEITTLATRGDELLGGFIGGKPQETPTWATFDEDKAPARAKPAATRSTTRPAPTEPASTTRRPRPWDRASTPEAAPATPAAPAEAAAPPTAASPAAPAPAEASVSGSPAAAPDRAADDGAAPLHTPQATSLSDTETTATDAAAEVSDAVVEAAMHVVPDPAGAEASATPGTGAAPPSEPGAGKANGKGTADAADPAAAESGAADPAAAESGAAEDDGPAALPGYDRMTLAQVRGHLRELTAQDVSTLLAYEQSGDNRAPFLTLLSNRLVTLGAQDS